MHAGSSPAARLGSYSSGVASEEQWVLAAAETPTEIGVTIPLPCISRALFSTKVESLVKRETPFRGTKIVAMIDVGREQLELDTRFNCKEPRPADFGLGVLLKHQSLSGTFSLKKRKEKAPRGYYSGTPSGILSLIEQL